MKLVIATPLYPPEIGGPATYAKLLADGLPKLGVEVEVIVFSGVRRLPRILRHYAYYRRVRTAARRADVVLALDPVSVGLPAMKAARAAGKPFFVKVVGDYAWEQGQQRFGITESLDAFVRNENVPFPVRLLRRVQTRVAQSATRVIVPSQYLKSIVVAWGIPAEKITVVYNTVPLNGVGTVPESVTKLQRPLVVTAGRLVPWKHVDKVIDAVAGTEGSLAIVGDGPLRVSISRHAGEKLGGRAVLTGLLSHKDTLAVIQAADVFVLNSSYEGLSHLLVEALTLGTPIVATRVGGNAEVVSDGEDGLLVPAADTASLQAAVARVLGDDALRARFRTNARESAKRFKIETMLASTMKALTIV